MRHHLGLSCFATTLALLLCLDGHQTAAAATARPALLIVSPKGTSDGWVDLDYLRELHAAGFEVDYTDSLADVTWERLRQYNVLVLYNCPPDPGQQGWPFRRPPPIYKTEFIGLVNRFVSQGGGVLLMALETQIGITLSRDLIKSWGADLPLERINDPANTAFMSRMPKIPLAYTSRVMASPVSAGVRGIWYPVNAHYNGADTLPLALDDDWQVVVRAMPSAHTVPVDLTQSSRPGPPNPLVRRGGVNAPPLFAIREYQAGRLAFLAQWPIYSIGSGTKWLYNREVLSKGLLGQPSDFGRLLENTFHWLAQPSLQTRTLGGHVTDPARLEPPNLRADVEEQFKESAWKPAGKRILQPPSAPPLFRGLIGAQTSLSGGAGSVADYAAAAKEAGLDFLVFLEDMAQLDDAKLSQLEADCQRYSDATVTLYPGYRMETNIGNHMFAFGRGVVLPPARLLTGPNQTTFMLQGETAPGVFGRTPPTAMEFLFSLTRDGQLGFYDFAHSGMGMRLSDARLYAMFALRTYRNGALVDDVTSDYLTTAQGTIVGAPAAVHLVTSPAALRSALQASQGLTYAAARSREQLWVDALLYTNQYTCPNVFTSTGPMIVQWPSCVRVATYGAEPFVTGRNLMQAPLAVTAEKGLREVRIYDGQQLYRRFKLNGERTFNQLLNLDASVQRNLVLVVDDLAGGQAVSFPRRSWKDGSLAPVFCSDRINDCVYMFLARGPYPMTVLRTPDLPDAGFTWDGGPRGILTPIDFEGSAPLVESANGKINGSQYNQTALLELADEGAVSVRSIRDELIDERVRAINPWNTYGPRAPASGIDFWLSYTQFDRANVAIPTMGWAAFPSQAGCNATLFRGSVRVKEALQIDGLRLLRNWNWIAGLDLHLVVGRRQRVVQDMRLPDMRWRSGPPSRKLAHFHIGRGDWFGFYSPGTANSQLFVNRGRSVELRLEIRQDGDWLSIWAAAPPDGTSGQRYRYELFGVGCPLDAAVHHTQGFVEQLAYLRRPEGLQISRGRRVNRPGTLELQAQQAAVHLSLPHPAARTQLTLPVVVNGLNRRWSAGLWQTNGFVKGDYGPGTNRYREVGLDLEGRAYVPLYPDLAERTEVEIGHPIIADVRGRDLFIQTTALAGGTYTNPEYQWSLDVNNPTDETITTRLTRNMDLPNLEFTSQEITLAAGEHRFLHVSAASAASTSH
jgi:hypothetical protein